MYTKHPIVKISLIAWVNLQKLIKFLSNNTVKYYKFKIKIHMNLQYICTTLKIHDIDLKSALFLSVNLLIELWRQINILIQ